MSEKQRLSPMGQPVPELTVADVERAQQHYERDGEIKIGGTALNSPSKAEAARQERMKREG